MINLRHQSLSLCLASIALLQLVTAQHNAPLGLSFSASPFPTATSGSSPSAIFLSPAALSSLADPYAAIPTLTDSTPTTIPTPSTTNHSVLNFYFFFLALFLVAIVVLYWVLRRKRTRLFADAARRRENALAADLERWPGNGPDRHDWSSGPRSGRWYRLRPARAQEGLNERGEAPPAYVAKPEPAHSADGGASASPEWIEMSGKPPDYEENRHT